jgi:2-polyprenyl-3-methyl-5-hydroxy-6-metoxy-1,4-benzoquinol methylase
MSNDGMDIYRSGEYAKRNPTWHAEDSSWKAGLILDAMSHCDLKPKMVAEVGCGAGVILSSMAHTLGDSVEFHGYDIAPAAIERARCLEEKSLHFHMADFLNEDTPHFDLLLCIDVVEHLENYPEFLRNIRDKALKYSMSHLK